MINRMSSNIFINKIQYAKATPSFGFLDTRDEFIKNHKLERIKMSDSIDNKVNIDNDKNCIISSFAEKKETLPLCFDMVLGATIGYLKNNIDAQTYARVFTSESPFVFQTAQYGIDNEKFSKKYAKDIDFVRQLDSLCASLKQGECDKKAFDVEFNNIMKKYIQS